ncbi:MAG: BsaWI family type II restriction enzyme [Paludibacteraceae bacterium]
MKDTYYQFCLDTYQEEYNRCFQACENEHKGDISPKLYDDFDRDAQKSAIRLTFVKALKKFPNQSVADLWSAIYRAHLFRKSGIADLDTINKVISADQSWKKASGHAFEEMIKELASVALHGTEIQVILQRDLNTLIKADELANEPRDISWLKEQIKANIFDLYGILSIDSKKYCFGCIQAKTSIRDRVTRDREPSIHAMQSFFWSVVFVLDGDFLRLPKFVSMINGGSDEFPENGWHGMYVLSARNENKRIYPITMDFDVFKSHALQAAEQWKKRRQWFDQNWMAQ